MKYYPIKQLQKDVYKRTVVFGHLQEKKTPFNFDG